MIKVNNRNTNINNFAPCSNVSFFNFEQVNAGWDSTSKFCTIPKIHTAVVK